MILLENDRLEFRFPEVHERARFSLNFQRTLRIPDDGGDYALPPGLGRFPLRHLDDCAAQLPEAQRGRGGVIMPMYQAEAMWIDFTAGYPVAVKISAGKICAVTGERWTGHLNTDPQDYLVLPDQPWLDGYCVERGVIRQFVAMPLGGGYSAEEQMTGEARHGGLQIVACPMKAEVWEREQEERAERQQRVIARLSIMELAPGGRMKQRIYRDKRGLNVWDQRHRVRCFVTIANAAEWMRLTGEAPPPTPVSARRYTEAGLPWFEWYDGDAEAVEGQAALAGLTSIAPMTLAKEGEPLADNDPLKPARTVRLGRTGREVREPEAVAGEW